MGSSAGFAKIDNPDKSGLNISEKVGQYTVPSGDEGLENGDVNGSKLTFFDYGVTPFFRVKVWVDKPVTVGMQLQNNPDWGNNPSGVKNILVEETNQWVDLSIILVHLKQLTTIEFKYILIGINQEVLQQVMFIILMIFTKEIPLKE